MNFNQYKAFLGILKISANIKEKLMDRARVRLGEPSRIAKILIELKNNTDHYKLLGNEELLKKLLKYRAEKKFDKALEDVLFIRRREIVSYLSTHTDIFSLDEADRGYIYVLLSTFFSRGFRDVRSMILDLIEKETNESYKEFLSQSIEPKSRKKISVMDISKAHKIARLTAKQ